MPRKLAIGEATPDAAFITDETGHDVAEMFRLGPSSIGLKGRNPLTSEEWQKVIDTIHEALKAKEI